MNTYGNEPESFDTRIERAILAAENFLNTEYTIASRESLLQKAVWVNALRFCTSSPQRNGGLKNDGSLRR